MKEIHIKVNSIRIEVFEKGDSNDYLFEVSDEGVWELIPESTYTRYDKTDIEAIAVCFEYLKNIKKKVK